MNLKPLQVKSINGKIYFYQSQMENIMDYLSK